MIDLAETFDIFLHEKLFLVISFHFAINLIFTLNTSPVKLFLTYLFIYEKTKITLNTDFVKVKN